MDPIEDAAAFDFREQWRADVAAGCAHPLAEYLARYPEHEGRVAREWLALVGTTTAPTSGPTPAVVAPATMQSGPYRLQHLLGRGGQGEVWLAEDARFAGRLVALKVLDGASFALDSARSARLRREAAALAKLDHPGICPLLDADLDGPRPWLAMRYVRGRTLHAELAANPSPPRTQPEMQRVLQWIERLALATHAAHAAGILHRDIKPANVMLDHDGLPVLLDFGLARDEDTETLAMTRSGDVFGTLAYMAPEQLRGDRDLDCRVDVYALGVTLYECLARRAPFAATTSQATSRDILAGSYRSLQQANPAVSRDLAIVVATAMELARERRYATARDFAEDLANVRERRPIRARAASTGLRALRWAQRHPATATALALLTATLATVTSLLVMFVTQTTELRAWKSVEAASRYVTTDPALALDRVTEAARGHSQFEIRSRLHAVLAAHRALYSLPVSHPDAPTIGAGTPLVMLGDRRTLVTGLLSGGLLRLRAADGAASPVVHGPSTASCTALAVASDGASLLLGTIDGGLYQLDAMALADGGWRGARIGTDPRHVLRIATARHSRRWFVGGTQGRLAWYERRADGSCSDGHSLPDLGEVDVLGLWPDPYGAHLLVHTAAPSQGGARRRALLRVDIERSEATPILTFPQSNDLMAEWSPDGKHFALAEESGTLLLAKQDGSECWRHVDDKPLLNAHFTPDGSRLVSFGFRGLVVRDLASVEPIHTTASVSGRSFQDGWFVAAGTTIVVAIKDQTLHLFDTQSWQPRAVLGPTHGFASHAFESADGVLTVCAFGAMHGFALRHRPFLPEFRDHTAPVLSVAFAPDGHAVASASSDGSVRIVDLATGELRRRIAEGTQPTRVLASGAHLLVIDGRPTARLWPWTANGTPIELVGHTTPIRDACAVVGAEAVITIGADGARLWNTNDGRLVRTFPTELGPLQAAAADQTTDRLAVAGEAPAIEVFALSTGQRLAHLDATHGARNLIAPPTQLHIDPHNHRLLAAAPHGGIAHTWDLAAAFAHRTFDGVGSSLGWCLTDGGGRWLVTAELSIDTVRWFDAVTLRPLPWQTEWRPGNKVTRAQFTNDGRCLLLASYDGTVRLFDMPSLSPWSILPAGHGGALDAAFSPDGERIVVGYNDGTVMVWPTDPYPTAEAHRVRRNRPTTQR